MVLDFQKKERFQSVLRDLIVQTCIETFGYKCTLDGIICVTVSLPGGNTDEIIAKFHEELGETTGSSRFEPYSVARASNKNKVIILSRDPPSGLKNYLTTPHRDVQKTFQNSKPYSGKLIASFKEISQQLAQDSDSPPLVSNSLSDRIQEVEFSCSMCFAKFFDYKELEKHFQEVHSSSVTHFCDRCSIGFESEADCAAHRQNHHNLKSDANESNPDSMAFKATQANRRKQPKPRRGVVDENNVDGAPITAWNITEEAEDSLNVANSQDIYKDDLIINENNNDLNQRNHNDFSEAAGDDLSSPEDYGQASLVQCPICRDAFDSFKMLDEHCHSLHRQYVCKFCFSTFPQRANRDKHLYQKHSGMKPFPCPACDASFTRRDALKKHMPKCKGILQTTSFSPSSSTRNSPLMSKYSILEATLQTKTENTSLDGSIKMEVDDIDCGLDLSHASRIKPNMDGNQSLFFYQEREFSDEKTPQGNRSNQNSEEEDEGPNNERAFPRSSEDGNSNSPSQHSLRSRKYKCDRCDTHVVGGTAFEDHCKIAHRRAPCLHCGKTFSQKGNMERHKRQHTGERPFICPECSCSYTRRETLKSHMSQSHGMQLPQPQPQMRQQLRMSNQMILSSPLLMQTLADAGTDDQSFKEEIPDIASSE